MFSEGLEIDYQVAMQWQVKLLPAMLAAHVGVLAAPLLPSPLLRAWEKQWKIAQALDPYHPHDIWMWLLTRVWPSRE